MLCCWVLERSPHMPYMAILNTHETERVPMLWPVASDKWQALSAVGRNLATRSRSSVDRHYDGLFPAAFGRFAGDYLGRAVEN